MTWTEKQVKAIENVFKSLCEDELTKEDRFRVESAKEQYQNALKKGRIEIVEEKK